MTRLQGFAGFTAAILLGAAGGASFVALSAPLPWLLGAMAACAVASLAGAPIFAPPETRRPMQAILGVVLGTAFDPALTAMIGQWAGSLLMVPLFIAAAGLLCVGWLRRTTGLDGPTAFYAGMPGGIAEMVVLGGEAGADTRMIALNHACRIFLVVLSMPFLISHVLGGSSHAAVTVVRAAPLGIAATVTALLWLGAAAIGGVALGTLLRLPARYLLGPLALAAMLRLSGVADFQVPHWLVIVAQLGMGVSIGCRFAGTDRRAIARVLVGSIGSTLILIALTIGFAAVAARITGNDVVTLALAFSPGGTAEMSMIALASGGNVSAVVAHHLVRLGFVTFGAGRLGGRRRRPIRPPG